MSLKDEFINIYRTNIKREGAEEFLSWLEKTDFFTAPASTKYHCACKEGLLKHSLNVYKVFMEKHFDENEDNLESVTICTLLHDLCKAQFYKTTTRNVKNELTGVWEQVPFYVVEDLFPYGINHQLNIIIRTRLSIKISKAVTNTKS